MIEAVDLARGRAERPYRLTDPGRDAFDTPARADTDVYSRRA
jgi:hypothetical protein